MSTDPVSSNSPKVAAPRTVLVTGSGKRLGREIALTLAASGWQVAVHYHQSEADANATVAQCAAFSGKSACFCANLQQENEVRQLLPQVIAHFGQLDAIVNNASLFQHDDAASFSFASLERHVRSNTGAPIILAQALHAHLTEREGHGAVVNLLDQKLWNTNPDFLSYTLSKAALEAANTALALAFAPRLRVVGVAPGLTLTSHMLDEAKFAELHRLSPLKRSSTPADVAATVKFALENNAITGTTILVDGGQHLMKFDRDFSLM